MNTAEHESWGEAVDEMEICRPDGMVGVGEKAFLCTGGHHIGPGQFIRCTSSYHQQDGPMSPGVGFLSA